MSTIPTRPRTKEEVRQYECETIALSIKMNPRPWMKEVLDVFLVNELKSRGRVVLPPTLNRWQRFCVWIAGL
jgi:hypothetical protein